MRTPGRTEEGEGGKEGREGPFGSRFRRHKSLGKRARGRADADDDGSQRDVRGGDRETIKFNSPSPSVIRVPKDRRRCIAGQDILKLPFRICIRHACNHYHYLCSSFSLSSIRSQAQNFNSFRVKRSRTERERERNDSKGAPISHPKPEPNFLSATCNIRRAAPVLFSPPTSRLSR